MYFQIVRQFQKQLKQMKAWFDIAAAHGKERSYDPNVLLQSRLAPDQFAFVRQVQASCDIAKLVASRLSGKEAPAHADTEATVDELRSRIDSVIAYLDGFSEADFAEAATRKVSQPRWEGKWMTGHDYLLEHGLPNFYFHTTTVYALLRHNGVPVGKRDYLGALSLRAPA
jgi:uncharacterized protein